MRSSMGSARSVTGAPGFSYAQRTNATRVRTTAYRGKTVSEKRLRDHFHERCGNLAPADCSLNARTSCTPSHRRDRGYKYIDSIAQTTRVCQGGTRKKSRQQHLFLRETNLGKLFEKSFPKPLQKLLSGIKWISFVQFRCVK